jgi:ADP-ribosyl-[dinitrogen reductase] hydrolase
MPPRRPATPTPDPYPHLRGRGALLGLCVGDALGVSVKGRTLVGPAFPQLADGIHRRMRGGGPFELKRGQVGENAQMACALGLSLREVGAYDATSVLRRYLAWNGGGVGQTEYTQELMAELLESGFPKPTAGRRVWMRGYRRVAHNGSLARTAPIGVFFKDAEERMRASMADSALTHFDPRCQLACAALNSSIAQALAGGEKLQREDLFTAAITGLNLASSTLGRESPELIHEVSTAAAFLREDLDLARQDDPHLYWPEMHMHRKPDHVRVAFRLAYWELVHAPTFEDALVDVIHRGGDSDANGAVAGALLGAFHGEEAIPEDWSLPVLSALGPPGGVLWTLYHPSHLLELVQE